MTPDAFVIAVPANDEAELVGDCLDSIAAAIGRTREPVAVVLVAHRCHDDTEDIARQSFSKLRGMAEGMVLRLDSGTVATARSAGAMAGLYLLSAYGIPFRRTWVLSTDADSRVPVDWLERYRPHLSSGAAAVTGRVRVSGWEDGPAEVTPDASAAYERLLRETHGHVYGANLAVRADAYLDVGGWPDQVPGEDHALMDALRSRNWPVTAAPEVVVGTSGRLNARAPGGLGALLGRLATNTAGRNARFIPKQALRSPS